MQFNSIEWIVLSTRVGFFWARANASWIQFKKLEKENFSNHLARYSVIVAISFLCNYLDFQDLDSVEVGFVKME